MVLCKLDEMRKCKNPERCHYTRIGEDSVSDLLRFCEEDLEASEL